MGDEVAVQRLEAALEEQARLTSRYEKAIGTEGELTAYARLQAATLDVRNCDRFAKRVAGERLAVAR